MARMKAAMAAVLVLEKEFWKLEERTLMLLS